MAMDKEQRNKTKNGAAFVGGSVINGSRRKENVREKCLIGLDADNAFGGFTDDVANALGDAAYIVYSTHSNNPSKNNKMRVIIPLSRIVTAVEYEAISRKIADRIGMSYFDHTTFEANRLFYFPSCPSDVVPVFISNGYEPLEADEVLAEYTDYLDVEQWAKHRDETKKLTTELTKIGDPTTKTGHVGLFCRAYSISEAIAEYLNEVYVPTDDSCTRYTYTHGTSFGGAKVHDDGKHLFSRHQSDPANTGTCFNAFDLVRVHLFSELDADIAPQTNTSKRPSFLAMMALVDGDKRCNGLKADELQNEFADDVSGERDIPAKVLFFENKRFVPKRMGDWFMTGRHAFVLNKELYIYKDGKYISGEDTFRQVAAEKLGTEYTPARIRDSLIYLLDILPKYTTDEVLNTPVDILNCKNGLLNLNTFELMEHTPNFISVTQLEAAYDPTADDSLFYEFMSKVVRPEEVLVVEEMLGNILIPSMEYEKAFILFGEGQNGKSTLSDLMLRFLGTSNVYGASLHELTENKFAKANLYGKMANIFPDESGKMLEDSKVFKTLVSGDSVTAEHKGRNAFTFKNRAKLIMSCNEIPKSRDKTDGNFRKYIIVEFPYKFEGKEMRRRLASWAELPSAILNVAIKGLKRLRMNERFTETERQKALINDLRADSDSVYAFIRDRIVVTKDKADRISMSDLYSAYTTYCYSEGLKPVGQKEFGKGRTRHLKNVEVDTHGIRSLKMVKLVNGNDDNSMPFENYEYDFLQ
jgi:putative DNA primase/helicase